MAAIKGKYGGRKVREGTVVSDKMQKTVLVAVEEHVKHRLYKKRVRRVRKFMAHDENETAHLGDRVRIIESRPISRNKRWAVVEVLERVELPEVAAESIDLELLGEVKPTAPEAGETQAPTAEPGPGTAEPVAAGPEPPEVTAEPETGPESPAAGEIVVEEAAQAPLPEPEPEPEAAAPEPPAEPEPEAEVAAQAPLPEPEPEPEALAPAEDADPVSEEATAEAPQDAAAEEEPK